VNEDPDVAAEREVVLNGERENAMYYPVVCYGLRKVFPPRRFPPAPAHVAVSDLHLAVAKGECFGLLGSNGAGKTSVLQMLTGGMLPTSGAATVSGFDIQTDSADVATVVGYCPQFDAFVPQLTGRENLEFFARLRGLSGEQTNLYVAELLLHLTLEGCADRPAQTYSGGNKRKLSVGIALIGNPPIVILDEPSTGVDPQARRSMWRLISSTMAHRSVILTTHSMEEAEALCDRVSIMHAGTLQCVGRTAYLKNKFGGGFLITMSSASTDVLDKATLLLQEHFPKAVVKGKRGVTIKVFLHSILADTVATQALHTVITSPQAHVTSHVNDSHCHDRDAADVSAASVFGVLEQVKSLTGIETYSVATSTLEDVFLRIVAPQYALSSPESNVNNVHSNTDSVSDNDSSGVSVSREAAFNSRSTTLTSAAPTQAMNSAHCSRRSAPVSGISKTNALEEPLLPQ